MATENVKDYLFEQTGIAQSQWKRLSKNKNTDGSETRIFQDKSSGKTFETIEFKDGNISIKESAEITTLKQSKNASSDDRKALKIIKKYFNDDDDVELTEEELQCKGIPKHFKFCFLEDSNVDHPTEIEAAADALDPTVTVAGFNIFFMPTFDIEYSSNHLAPLISNFLPEFLGETEECAFTVHPEVQHMYDDERIEEIKNGTFPNIPYDRLIATLENAGFTYYSKKCMLAKLGGSQGAKPFEVKEPAKGEFKFCLVAVKDPSYNSIYDRTKNKDGDHITAIVLDVNKDRNSKEKLINQALKKYKCAYPGRLMNGMLPQIELFQVVKKGSGNNQTNNEDRQTIYDTLIELGWKCDPSLASLENAQKWTLEQWAVTPMPKSPFVIHNSGSSVSDHASNISYYIWEPKQPKLKM